MFVWLQKWYINANVQCFHGTHTIIGTTAIIFLVITIFLIPFVGVISCGYLFKVCSSFKINFIHHLVCTKITYFGIYSYVLYAMKVSRQKSFAASCTCRPSQKKLSQNPSYFLLNHIEQQYLELLYKKVLWTCKKVRKPWNFSALKLLRYTVCVEYYT